MSESELIAQLRATAAELESVWKHLSRRPNMHVEAACNLIARIELQEEQTDDKSSHLPHMQAAVAGCRGS